MTIQCNRKYINSKGSRYRKEKYFFKFCKHDYNSLHISFNY